MERTTLTLVQSLPGISRWFEVDKRELVSSHLHQQPHPAADPGGSGPGQAVWSVCFISSTDPCLFILEPLPYLRRVLPADLGGVGGFFLFFSELCREKKETPEAALASANGSVRGEASHLG